MVQLALSPNEGSVHVQELRGPGARNDRPEASEQIQKNAISRGSSVRVGPSKQRAWRQLRAIFPECILHSLFAEQEEQGMLWAGQNHFIFSFLPAFGLMVFKSLFSLAWPRGMDHQELSSFDLWCRQMVCFLRCPLCRVSWPAINNSGRQVSKSGKPHQLRMTMRYVTFTETGSLAFSHRHVQFLPLYMISISQRVLYLIQMQPCRSVIHFKDGRGRITSPGDENIV